MARKKKPAFPEVARSYWSWIKAVTAEIRNEVRRETIDEETGEVFEVYPVGFASCPSLRRAMESRASKLIRCMRRVEGRICGDEKTGDGCGRPRSRGVFRMKEPRKGRRCKKDHSHIMERCHLRSCPRCARIRAANYHTYGDRLRDLFLKNRDEQIELWGARDYRPKLITLTCERDPADPAAHTVEALKERARGLRDAFRAIITWDRERALEPGWIGAFVALEMCGTGHVHMHILYHGPLVDTDRHGAPIGWIAIGQRGYTDRRGRRYPGYADLGSVGDVRKADDKTIREVAKYPLKSPGSGPDAAEWIGGKKRMVVNPTLAARWEVATYGCRLVERYGLCRLEAAPDENAENEETTAPEAPIGPCPFCGRVKTVLMLFSTSDWIKACAKAEIDPFGKRRPVGAAKEKG